MSKRRLDSVSSYDSFQCVHILHRTEEFVQGSKDGTPSTAGGAAKAWKMKVMNTGTPHAPRPSEVLVQCTLVGSRATNEYTPVQQGR